jgi:hypothetical protein
MPCVSHPPWFYHSNSIWQGVQILELIMQWVVQRIRPSPRPPTTFHSLFFTVRSYYLLAQSSSWGTTSYRLPTTNYLMYSQLHSIPGGRLVSSIRHRRTHDAMVTRDPLNIGLHNDSMLVSTLCGLQTVVEASYLAYAFTKSRLVISMCWNMWQKKSTPDSARARTPDHRRGYTTRPLTSIIYSQMNDGSGRKAME